MNERIETILLLREDNLQLKWSNGDELLYAEELDEEIVFADFVGSNKLLIKIENILYMVITGWNSNFTEKYQVINFSDNWVVMMK